MTVSSATNKAQYIGNGVTTVFSVPFYFQQNSDIVVTRTVIATGVDTVLALNTDYTLTGAANPSGGSVTLSVAPTSAQRVTVQRIVPYTQLVDYTESSTFPAETHEAALDKCMMATAQLAEALGRALVFPATSTQTTVTLPALTAGYYLAVNAAGTALEWRSSVFPQYVADDIQFTGNIELDNAAFTGPSTFNDEATFLADPLFASGRLALSGSLLEDASYNLFTKTSTYTIQDTDDYILANTTAGGFTITLPSASGRLGKRFTVKCIGTANNVTVATTSSQQIDNGLTGGGTSVAFAQPTARTFVSNGTGWYVV